MLWCVEQEGGPKCKSQVQVKKIKKKFNTWENKVTRSKALSPKKQSPKLNTQRNTRKQGKTEKHNRTRQRETQRLINTREAGIILHRWNTTGQGTDDHTGGKQDKGRKHKEWHFKRKQEKENSELTTKQKHKCKNKKNTANVHKLKSP